MRFGELLKSRDRTFSFEFFPPRSDEAVEGLVHRARELAQLHPSFVSVTYGAGGSTRDRTRQLVARLTHEAGLNTAAHLTCVGHSQGEIADILTRYRERGVQNIVALRGDRAADNDATRDAFHNAVDLVRLIKDRFSDTFGVAVAGYPEGHPETTNKLADVGFLKAKVDAGADTVITQLFFDNRDFLDFRERCEMSGIAVPILAGIMPVLSWRGIQRMAGLCGARIPARLLARLQRATHDDAEVARIGIDWAVNQCADLLERQVRGIHFYTLNRSSATLEIFRQLGVSDAGTLKTPPAAGRIIE